MFAINETKHINISNDYGYIKYSIIDPLPFILFIGWNELD